MGASALGGARALIHLSVSERGQQTTRCRRSRRVGGGGGGPQAAPEWKGRTRSALLQHGTRRGHQRRRRVLRGQRQCSTGAIPRMTTSFVSDEKRTTHITSTRDSRKQCVDLRRVRVKVPALCGFCARSFLLPTKSVAVKDASTRWTTAYEPYLARGQTGFLPRRDWREVCLVQ